MQKKFNITGTCRPTQHYMADISHKYTDTMDYINTGEYFIINRPRQYGKTTLLYTIARTVRANSEYVAFNISFEGIGDAVFTDEKVFVPCFLGLLLDQAEIFYPDLIPILKEKQKEVDNFDNLSKAITVILRQTPQKVILLIDEVDKSKIGRAHV